MKFLVLGIILFSVNQVSADIIVPVSVDLTCKTVGVGKAQIITIKANALNRRGTEITISGTKIVNPSSLYLSSEGSVYIQQVSNVLGYNLMLYGKELNSFLSNSNLRKVQLQGRFHRLGTAVPLEMVCAGLVMSHL